MYLHIITDLDSLMAPLPFCPDDAPFLSPKFLVSIYLTKQQFSTLSQSILNDLRPKEELVFLDHVHEEAFEKLPSPRNDFHDRSESCEA